MRDRNLRVLFINMGLEGHHIDYITTLTQIKNIEPHVILEKDAPQIPGVHHVISDVRFGTKNICEHLRWMKKIKKIYKQVRPDVIHFVWGDSFYCMMGVGFFG